MIAVKNLTKKFGGHLVLDDITENINAGERIALADRPVPVNQRFCAA